MSYPKQLLRLRPARGLGLDLPANEMGPDFYTGGSNVIFRQGFAQRIPGRRAAYSQSTTNPIFALQNARAPGGVTESNFWLVFGQAEIQALETSNITAVTPAAGLTSIPAPWQWTPTMLNNIPCATNTVDAPIYWGGDVATPFATLPGWPSGSTCQSLCAFRFHLFALDITEAAGHYESKIMWSDAAAAGAIPSTWVAAATNEAGSAILADTPGPAMLGIPLQDTLIIFKRASAYGVNYIQTGDIFQVRLLDGDRGALTRHAACDIGGRIFVVSDGEIYLTDGVNWQPIATGLVRDYLFGQLDQTNYENLHVQHHRSKNEVWVRYPQAGNTYCTEALIYNIATGGWGVRSLSNGTCAAIGVVNDTSPDESWDADSNTWDSDDSYWNAANYSLAVEQLLTAVDGAAITLEDDDTATTEAATLFKHDMTMGQPERLKLVRRVNVRTNDAPGTLYIRVGSRNSVTDSITWDAEQTLATPADHVNVRTLGKYISLEVRSAGSDVWQVSGFDLEYEWRGYN